MRRATIATALLLTGALAGGALAATDEPAHEDCVLLYPTADGAVLLEHWVEGEDTGLVYCPTGERTGF